MKDHKNIVFIVFSVLIMIFQSPLSMSGLPEVISSAIKNYDEILTFILLLFIFLSFLRNGVPKEYIKELVSLIVFLLAGMLGTLINNLQPLIAVFEDFVNCSKFFVTFFGISILYKRFSSKVILNVLQKISIYLVIILFVLTLIDLAVPQLLFENDYTRYGIHAVHLFYYHPAALSQVIVLLLSIVSIESVSLKHITAYKIMCLFMLASTLRSKAFGFICLYIFVWFFDKNKTRAFRIILIMLVALMILFVSIDSISLYYGDKNSARATLTIDSLAIANSNVPLGLGFGTFASASAAKYYSSVYEKLGYDSRYGMGYVNNDYLTDSFLPVILGEFGYVGLLSYSAIIVFLIKRSILLFRKNRKLGLASISIMGYLLICSTSATAFFNPMAVPDGIILALIFNVTYKKSSNTLRTYKYIRGVRKNEYR